MDLRQILLLVVTGLYFWFCHWFICCKTFAVCYSCGDTQITQVIAPALSQEEEENTANFESTVKEGLDSPLPATSSNNNGPLLFNWESDQPITSSLFPDYRDSILTNNADSKLLEITGHYFADEVKPKNHSNMGLARAARVKELFEGDIAENNIQLRARLVDEPEDAAYDLFQSASFRWIEETPTSYDDKGNGSRVEQLEDRALIYFPFNSSDKEFNPKVDQYLSSLVEKMQATAANIQLVGHTDDKGKERPNFRLAKIRAKKIKEILIKKGLAENRIEVISKGQEEPIVPNDTEANRRLNRRVEVKIVE